MTIFWLGTAVFAIGSALFLGWPAIRSATGRSRFLVLTTAVLVPFSGFALYAQAGHPGMADRPLASRGQEAEAALQMAAYRQMLDKLASQLAANPDDVAGWTTLGTGYGRLGAFAQASDAFAKAHALRPDDAALALTHAEMLIRAADDRITGDAAVMLDAVLKSDPTHHKARLLKGLFHAQAGHADEARTMWSRLLTDLPAESPWRAALKDNLARLGPPKGAL